MRIAIFSARDFEPRSLMGLVGIATGILARLFGFGGALSSVTGGDSSNYTAQCLPRINPRIEGAGNHDKDS
jgi:hypothetical protein